MAENNGLEGEGGGGEGGWPKYVKTFIVTHPHIKTFQIIISSGDWEREREGERDWERQRERHREIERDRESWKKEKRVGS